jgi:hypothetical protein
MIITNKYGLPQTFLNVVERPTYTKGKAHMSVTELLNSPQIVQLKAKYSEQIEVDVTDMIWAVFGTAVHHVLEQGKDPNHIVEQRLHSEIDGWHISGAIDLQIVHEDGIEVNDYKTVGAWAVMNEKPDWEQQQNVYGWLVRREKKKNVKGVKIIALIRDWNRREAERREDYPKAPIQVIELRLWSHQEAEEFVRSRIAAHNTGKVAIAFDEELPLCTDEDRWVRETKFAVMKQGRKRAVKLFDNEADAKQFAEQEKGYVETRNGEAIRCAGDYCGVSQWCSQYRQQNAGGDEEGGVRPEGRQE